MLRKTEYFKQNGIPRMRNIIKTVLSPISGASKSLSSLLGMTFSLNGNEDNDDTVYNIMTRQVDTSTPKPSSNNLSNEHSGYSSILINDNEHSGSDTISLNDEEHSGSSSILVQDTNKDEESKVNGQSRETKLDMSQTMVKHKLVIPTCLLLVILMTHYYPHNLM